MMIAVSPTKNAAAEILDTLGARRDRAIIHNGKNWITTYHADMVNLADQHIRGNLTAGYMVTHDRKCATIDLDAHGDLLPGIRSEILNSKYNAIVERHGMPSAVFLTKGIDHPNGFGLHLIYFFRHPIPHRLIADAWKIAGHTEELLPTPTKGIRLPYAAQHGGHALDPLTLKQLHHVPPRDPESAREHLAECSKVRIDPADFLKIGRNLLRAFKKNRPRGRPRNYLKIAGIVPTAGHTNEYIMATARAGIIAGWNDEMIADIIERDLAGIPQNADTTRRKIITRIRALRKGFIQNITAPLRTEIVRIEENETAALIYKKIIDITGPLHHRRDAALKKFIQSLLRAKANIDSLTHNKAKMLSFPYQGFEKNWLPGTRNIEERRYPLPRELFRKMAGGRGTQYLVFLDYLRLAGIVKNGWTGTSKHSGYHPTPDREDMGKATKKAFLPGMAQNKGIGICRHYYIILPLLPTIPTTPLTPCFQGKTVKYPSMRCG